VFRARSREPSPDCERLRGEVPQVQANPNANQLGRKSADEFARDFKRGKDEVKVSGERGRAVELARR
jgi:hypothetical protein